MGDYEEQWRWQDIGGIDPPERKWVGLTKKDQTAIVNNWKLMSATPERLCRMVEAILKEKNT